MTLTAPETTLLLGTFAFIAIVVGLLDPSPVIAFWRRTCAWLREEARLVHEESWADGIYQGPGTGADPRVAAVAEKQRELAVRMRKEGRHLLSGKRYTPAGTKPLEPAPPRAAAVVTPIRARGAKR